MATDDAVGEAVKATPVANIEKAARWWNWMVVSLPFVLNAAGLAIGLALWLGAVGALINQIANVGWARGIYVTDKDAACMGRVLWLGVTAGGVFDLGAGWSLDGYLGLAEERGESLIFKAVNSAFLAEALGNVPDKGVRHVDSVFDAFAPPLAAE